MIIKLLDYVYIINMIYYYGFINIFINICDVSIYKILCISREYFLVLCLI